jgi:mRNA-degrading endonuclease RelE of RelBE toxin-antitoxin system
MEEDVKIRNLIYTDEFKEYYSLLDERIKDKYTYCFDILETIYVLSSKFVKKLSETSDNLYELRISVGSDEHRSIIFSANHDNIIQATEIIILNGFLKKSSKDYAKQIKKAGNILNTLKL